MMKKLHLNIVSPEKELFNGEVESVTLPGTMGSLDIQSGFVEMSNGRVAVCIEQQ